MKTITVLVISALLAAPAFASKYEHYGERMMQRISKHLELNESQQEQLKSIFEAKKPQMEAIREQMKALREDTNKQIEAILTEEQKEKFEAHLERRKEMRDDHHHRFSKHQL